MAAIAFTPLALAVLSASAPWMASVTQDGGGGEIAPRRGQRVDAVEQGCGGTVVGVTKDSIVVRPSEGGPPRRFTVSKALAAGGYERDAFEGCRYTLADVLPGDVVGIDYDRVNGVDVCKRFCIRRRPGGRVPPARDPNPYSAVLPHEWANAYQDLEEKGIPLPERLRSPAPGPVMPIPNP